VPLEPELRARKRFFEQARTMTPYVAAEYDGTIFVVPTAADAKLFVNQRRKDLRILRQAVATAREHGTQAGSTFVDVGAHIGTSTVSALAHHGFERAVSIEPDPDNLRLLRANLALNDMDRRATVVPAAVSSSPGTASFTRRAPDSGPSYSTKGRITDEAAPDALVVDVVTLDGLVEQGVVEPGDVGLLWLDCQKQEVTALQAAGRFLERRVPVVFALRRQEISPESPYLELLAGYERFVDLRRDGGAALDGSWRPVLEPLGELFERRAGSKSLTDVLAF
jgi:FkbM family methyltransferase